MVNLHLKFTLIPLICALFKSTGYCMIREISPNFLCVGVSGLSSDLLLQGRPYGGCSILYHKSFPLSVTSLHSSSNHFCGIKI